ncbi:uncharacterized protein LOC103724214 isoform X2 [Phoenix dactylifera]|uniref:Uncharacterized protein LOC103724214 isoform X2 n=1 Tax=Phoenix dactylifera TaxID=42345 RepID=A0A8B8ZZI5_PHODC|nr:uncharacterized protein LOC120103697 isoform X2 [Phoenix dactylifera]XP_038979726.1 uncharacterized protein LOC103724214 isoform X2 [Phoenix dactylifera]
MVRFPRYFPSSFPPVATEFLVFKPSVLLAISLSLSLPTSESSLSPSPLCVSERLSSRRWGRYWPLFRIKSMEYDINLDGLLDREEFAEFIHELTADTITTVSRNLILALVVTPTVALMTKRATEGVPGVGKVVQRLPNSMYALIVALGVVLAQKSGECCE